MVQLVARLDLVKKAPVRIRMSPYSSLHIDNLYGTIKK